MTLIKTTLSSAALLAGGLFAMAPDTADAQIRFQIGGGNGYGFGNGGFRGGNPGIRYNNYGGYGSRYNGFSSGQRYSGYHGNSVWHDTSRYGHHPTEVRRRGNHHHHVQPGQYDFHQPGHRDFRQTGHYDRVRGGHDGHGGYSH